MFMLFYYLLLLKNNFIRKYYTRVWDFFTALYFSIVLFAECKLL